MRNYCVERDRVQGFVKIAFNSELVTNFLHALIEFGGLARSSLSIRNVIDGRTTNGQVSLSPIRSTLTLLGDETAVWRQKCSKLCGKKIARFHCHLDPSGNTSGIFAFFSFLDISSAKTDYPMVPMKKWLNSRNLNRIFAFLRDHSQVWIGFCKGSGKRRISLFRTRFNFSINLDDTLVGFGN